jgi:hypothetical protein
VTFLGLVSHGHPSNKATRFVAEVILVTQKETQHFAQQAHSPQAACSEFAPSHQTTKISRSKGTISKTM